MKAIQDYSQYIIAIFLAGILNLIWEVSHHGLYRDLTGIPIPLHLLMATGADMLLVGGIYLLMSLKNKSVDWILHPSRADYILMMFLGLCMAIILEKVNLHLGRWEYTSQMPIIFGIGLSPLLQLTVTSSASVYILHGLHKNQDS